MVLCSSYFVGEIPFLISVLINYQNNRNSSKEGANLKGKGWGLLKEMGAYKSSFILANEKK